MARFKVNRGRVVRLVLLAVVLVVCVKLLGNAFDDTDPASNTQVASKPSKLPNQLLRFNLDSDSVQFISSAQLQQQWNLPLISRGTGVTVTSDTRGNLGPCSVVVQESPGSDWLKDRWQAASDMGGTAIPGEHWLVLDFHRRVEGHQVVLDWETAYAECYRLETQPEGEIIADAWQVLFDGCKGEVGPDGRLVTPGRSSASNGQSPGVSRALPLHIVHTVTLRLQDKEAAHVFRYLRVFIVKPAAGWGVSLWQVDVYGRQRD